MRPTLNVLAPDLIERIIDEAKQVLAEVGIEVRGPRLKERLLERGIAADPTDDRLRFPPDVVDRAIADAPASFTLFDRDGAAHATLGGESVHFVPASSGLNILDHRTQERRRANTADFVEYVRLADGLEHIAYLATAFSANDVDAVISDVWRLYLILTNSKQPVVTGAFTEDGVPRMAEMMALFRSGKADLMQRPMAIFTITATGNFRYSEDSCQNLLDCVEWGIPVEIVPVTLMGLVAPVTLVGACVFHTVDVLAGITMAQLIRPGAPVLFGGASAAFHMQEATSPMLAVAAQRLDMAYAAIGKHLGLPTQAYMGLSDAKFLDAQAGAETYGSALLAGLAGINSVAGPGMLNYVLTFCLPKLVFDNEVCGQILYLLRQTHILDDLPTIDLVRAQLAEGHMLTAPHTIGHWPDELHLPGSTWDRKSDENWTASGGKDLWARAVEEVEMRLSSYEPVETDPAIDAELRRVLYGDAMTNRPLPDVPPAISHRAVSRREQNRAERQARREART